MIDVLRISLFHHRFQTFIQTEMKLMMMSHMRVVVEKMHNQR